MRRMQATCDFTADLGGVTYSLKKGETFDGDRRAVEKLKGMGLVAAARPRKKGRPRNGR